MSPKLISLCFVGARSPFLPNFLSRVSVSTKMVGATPGSNEICAASTISHRQTWDTERYQSQHSFVWKYGSSLVDLLNVQPGERILDLGCGTGELTKEIASKGNAPPNAVVMGMDSDPKMIERAKQQFPEISFFLGDARSFEVSQPVDAVFSNAALHWVKEAEQAVQSISHSLKPGGRFVAEFGGKGNVREIEAYLLRATGKSESPWYFPSIAEYSALLEQHGLEVTLAELFHRPTPLEAREDGLRNWILMFGDIFLSGAADGAKEAVLSGAEQELRVKLNDGERWSADYRRIRVVAHKVT